jgi:hypothetical protein
VSVRDMALWRRGPTYALQLVLAGGWHVVARAEKLFAHGLDEEQADREGGGLEHEPLHGREKVGKVGRPVLLGNVDQDLGQLGADEARGGRLADGRRRGQKRHEKAAHLGTLVQRHRLPRAPHMVLQDRQTEPLHVRDLWRPQVPKRVAPRIGLPAKLAQESVYKTTVRVSPGQKGGGGEGEGGGAAAPVSATRAAARGSYNAWTSAGTSIAAIVWLSVNRGRRRGAAPR